MFEANVNMFYSSIDEQAHNVADDILAIQEDQKVFPRLQRDQRQSYQPHGKQRIYPPGTFKRRNFHYLQMSWFFLTHLLFFSDCRDSTQAEKDKETRFSLERQLFIF